MNRWVMQVIISVTLGVAGQLLFKEGASKLDITVSGAGGIFQLLWRMFTNPWVFAGLVCYGLSTILWILILKEKDLSMVYPMLASGYILVVLFSWLVRHETIAPSRWLGAVVISLGVWLIARS